MYILRILHNDSSILLHQSEGQTPIIDGRLNFDLFYSLIIINNGSELFLQLLK